MTHDPAAFREADLDAVYGPASQRTCFQTAKVGTFEQSVDKHHIYGRGGYYPGDRTVHSSILNCCLLRRDIHHGPMRDRPYQRVAYLDESIRRVLTAVGSGVYALRDEDRAFLRQYRPGMLDEC